MISVWYADKVFIGGIITYSRRGERNPVEFACFVEILLFCFLFGVQKSGWRSGQVTADGVTSEYINITNDKML